MKRCLLSLLTFIVAVAALSQEGRVAVPVPPPVFVQADLGIVKTYRPASPAGPAAFIITVTNYGPSAAPGFTVNDPAPPGTTIGIGSNPPPWVCTAGVSCTYAAQLAVGNSATLVLPVTITGATTNVVNCASVLPKDFIDPNDKNNRDCACVDINPCRDISIDITTGVQNGAQLGINVPDNEWLINTTGTTPSRTSGGTSWNTPSPPPGRYITYPTSVGQGTYPFRFNFTLGNEWRTGQCRVILQQFRADNCVRFNVDSLVPFAATPPANCSTSAAWTVPGSASYTIPNPAGSHTLTANVTNNEGPMGLYVRGTITCRCNGWPADPPPPPNPN
jgi:uncharacterized repeat protein (TIGR01451 family)